MKYNTALPYFESEDIQYVIDEFRKILGGEGLLTMGRHVHAFKEEFAKYIGAKHAVATSSCTGALETIMTAIDIGRGDEVVIPAQTFIATASSVAKIGAKPVFAEIKNIFAVLLLRKSILDLISLFVILSIFN